MNNEFINQSFPYPGAGFDFIRVPKLLIREGIVSPDAALLFAFS